MFASTKVNFMETQITKPFSQINNRLRKDKKTESRIDINLNISFNIIWTVINHSARQSSKSSDRNLWDKIKKWVHLFKWLVQILISLVV